jgi:signal transduction histidine kinase
MTPPEDKSALPQLLALDRQAVVGGLSAGIVHAINNVLSGILGQTDLLLLNRLDPQMKGDLEQISSTCDEGVHLLRNLGLLISSMKDSNPTDPEPIVEAIAALLARIFNRSGIKQEMVIEGTLAPVRNGDEYSQTLFHLGLLAYQTLSQSNISARKVSFRLSGKRDSLRLELSGDSRLLLSTNASPIRSPESLIEHTSEDLQWHKWVLSQITERVGGSWGVSSDGCSLYLDWPVLNTGAPVTY